MNRWESLKGEVWPPGRAWNVAAHASNGGEGAWGRGGGGVLIVHLFLKLCHQLSNSSNILISS